MVAHIDEQLEPLLRARRYAKVGLTVPIAVGLWLLALLTHWAVITFATILLLITLGFCHIALSPNRQDETAIPEGTCP